MMQSVMLKLDKVEQFVSNSESRIKKEWKAVAQCVNCESRIGTYRLDIPFLQGCCNLIHKISLW
jgi:hypothetical protein